MASYTPGVSPDKTFLAHPYPATPSYCRLRRIVTPDRFDGAPKHTGFRHLRGSRQHRDLRVPVPKMMTRYGAPPILAYVCGDAIDAGMWAPMAGLYAARGWNVRPVDRSAVTLTPVIGGSPPD